MTWRARGGSPYESASNQRRDRWLSQRFSQGLLSAHVEAPVHWLIRASRSRAIVATLAAAPLFVGCARSLSHEFSAPAARDYVTDRARTDGPRTPRSELSVLLIPEHTTVYRPDLPSSSPSWMGDTGQPVVEDYVGPARVFLVPGEHSYVVAVETTEGFVKLELNAEFEPRQRYELHIAEDGEQVTMELFKLHPSSYAALYPSR